MKTIKVNKNTDQFESTDNQWFEIEEKWFEHECCDCGLTHKVYLKVLENGHVAIKFKRLEN